ncbi:MAG: glycosyltransferase [Roseovarius sp.]
MAALEHVAEGGETDTARIAAVVIGRNEGARLEACLASLQGMVGQICYVDSGSTDGSVEHARAVGAHVVALDGSQPFTAARARNAGLATLDRADVSLVQFVDGDCVVAPGWISAARALLEARPEVGVVCGRRREAHPEASIYNRLCDLEWQGPAGEVRACGGDALMRLAALDAVGGYDPSLIAGEEPELCVRLRQAGWKIWRLDAEMTLHDARMTRFSQWWRRSLRAGHAFAEGAALHGAPPERHWVAETRRALLWGAALPLAIRAAALAHPAALVLFAAYPVQVLRLAARHGLARRAAWEWALFTVLGKFAEASGALRYYAGRATQRRATLIEYKS